MFQLPTSTENAWVILSSKLILSIQRMVERATSISMIPMLDCPQTSAETKIENQGPVVESIRGQVIKCFLTL